MATAPRKTPAKPAAPRKARPKGDFNGAPPQTFDHDGDGKAGGSRPKIGLGAHEFDALCLEAYEAHDYSAERVRFDTLGRRWTFTPDKEAGHSVIRLKVEHLTGLAEGMISTAVLATDDRLSRLGEQLTGLAAQLK